MLENIWKWNPHIAKGLPAPLKNAKRSYQKIILFLSQPMFVKSESIPLQKWSKSDKQNYSLNIIYNTYLD